MKRNKINVRLGAFETNSSSAHTILISKNTATTTDEEIEEVLNMISDEPLKALTTSEGIYLPIAEMEIFDGEEKDSDGNLYFGFMTTDSVSKDKVKLL